MGGANRLVWASRRAAWHARRWSTGYLDARTGEANGRQCIHARLSCMHVFMPVWVRQAGFSSCCGVHAWHACGHMLTLAWAKQAGSSGLSLSLSLLHVRMHSSSRAYACIRRARLGGLCVAANAHSMWARLESRHTSVLLPIAFPGHFSAQVNIMPGLPQHVG